MSKDNGEPAFPAPAASMKHYGTAAGYTGMTLRDYFAAKVMAALISKSSLRTDEIIADVAVASYGIADAMIAERAK